MLPLFFLGCSNNNKTEALTKFPYAGTAENYLLPSAVEKTFGYSHAVKIGNELKISWSVSMVEKGNPTATGDLEQQMKNCHNHLEK